MASPEPSAEASQAITSTRPAGTPATDQPAPPATDMASGNPGPNAPSLGGEGNEYQTAQPLTQSLSQDIDFLTDENALQDVETALANSYAKVMGIPAAFLDAATIQILIELGLSLFKKCMESRAAKAAAGGGATTPAGLGEQYQKMAKRPTRFARAFVSDHVRDTLREKHGLFAFRRYDGDKMVDTLLDAAANATPATMQRFVQAGIVM